MVSCADHRRSRTLSKNVPTAEDGFRRKRLALNEHYSAEGLKSTPTEARYGRTTPICRSGSIRIGSANEKEKVSREIPNGTIYANVFCTAIISFQTRLARKKIAGMAC